ncbi:MAG: Holliday junction DNA helicase RuvA [Omnitrophica bacterium RIFCSPLOWO2_12_FULL_44_17]|uniref:Holliday junction branch migration complex subunit RuvA n=1 Tax=Candidatus Danuiimicrobium aquiferis TaxID=1801832 RepID=A0A1G1KTT8_9BACT|nr:MAG: Holliday junction DNA helicase RuvA [Omnitrophica bacterium RIFCSPHIGHO2_02_FULL_45_28]OGW88274.1 MAG: Holliday junction DNA helicase RuvA [Omnitrophica bacterium RIFCSPHIGHO2_12_FULL_44_12]OGW95969.1 MAG: Holliday junction DNA helicase RuvA [Omnitrophica bacterium RIFCSPLOWO2_12_FULL_44_17]OGX01963.1 MAG: Holliday junction DNA helicase RuvA [Omnitrophica bacterium RIFCSPLOWO2_02_FULL_44_11]
MYSFLSGTLVEKHPTTAILDVNGIGFEVMIPLSTSQKLPSAGNQVKLRTHFVVREDAHLLFGFFTEEERSLFRLLIGVTGIGPKLGITLLSGLELNELKRAIVHGSIPALTAIPGIGRKIAERLIVELREKIILEKEHDSNETSPRVQNEILVQDSVQALMSLGYNKQSAKTAIQKVMEQNQKAEWDTETLIRAALKYI